MHRNIKFLRWGKNWHGASPHPCVAPKYVPFLFRYTHLNAACKHLRMPLTPLQVPGFVGGDQFGWCE